MSSTSINQADLESFSNHLRYSERVLALCGAGLSAASGLPTFRGAGGLWRSYDAVSLATPTAFNENPGLVWQFYSYRRHMALKAKPNAAHYALAELAKRKKGFLTLTQNVDGTEILHLRCMKVTNVSLQDLVHELDTQHPSYFIFMVPSSTSNVLPSIATISSRIITSTQ